MEAANALVAKANKQYALKDYAEAADKYAEAAEEVAKVNGEDDPRNADVLFLYGRCLFKLAVERSQVLGGGGTDDKAADKAAVGATPKEAPKGPMFSFEGDEPDEEDEDAQADEEDQEDDFHNAWEVLDMARVMYEKQRDAASSEDAIDIKKRLGDTFELLGEIALENENFAQAASDLTSALNIKKEVFPKHSRERSSAHYMLALAREYAPGDDARKEAALELQQAIEGFEARLKNAEAGSEKDDEASMLQELKTKLAELEEPPEQLLKDSIAKIFNGQKASLKDSLVTAMQTSTDLSTLVRKKGTKRSTATTEALSKAEESTKRTKTDQSEDSSDVRNA